MSVQPVFADSSFGGFAIIQYLQIDYSRVQQNKIVLTMSTTWVDAIVEVVGISDTPSTVVSTFKGLLLRQIIEMQLLNPCCQRYFLVMRLSFARSGNQPVSAP